MLKYNYKRQQINNNIIRKNIREDEKMTKKQIKKTIHETLCPGGGKIACAILYTENRVVWCDYRQKDDVTGQYTLSYRNGVDFSI